MEPQSYSKSAYFLALANAGGAALFMAAAPFIFAAIIWQGGLGTVPVYDGKSGPVLFYINNVVAAAAFSALWFAISGLVFRHCRKVLVRLKSQRNAA